ncbi:hypothetical protein M1B72_16535 [Geomonas paludis]|uniref:Uncharacterized protein n=1 Tax=Geomonas paludis TaxID=2740185 RepID=A0A6V8MWC4_9BACT|nr:hypothetical protein [Geomonas paludis]UPU35044.1 hypothetical protein M1B72_16535 [Geomonas paludis]GFO64505.1 hypothetical protein GMPD_24240 [Geomonas paludis]
MFLLQFAFLVPRERDSMDTPFAREGQVKKAKSKTIGHGENLRKSEKTFKALRG